MFSQTERTTNPDKPEPRNQGPDGGVHDWRRMIRFMQEKSHQLCWEHVEHGKTKNSKVLKDSGSPPQC